LEEIALGCLCWVDIDYCKHSSSNHYLTFHMTNSAQLRIIYRLIEFSGGREESKNPLPFKEIYIYILEVLPMFFAIGVFLVVHPGRVLVGRDCELPGLWATFKGRRGKSEGSKGKKVVDIESHELTGRYEKIGNETPDENFRR